MKLADLRRTVSEHSGTFDCIARGGQSKSKQIAFEHLFAPPEKVPQVPDIGLLKGFYSTFGELRLYHDQISGESAFHIAPPSQWEALRKNFFVWIEMLDEEERLQVVPNWVNDCIVFGEIPHSGNYLLMATSTDKSGHVFKFDHDGFEIKEMGSNIGTFVTNVLSPDGETLTDMAGHMTFLSGDFTTQWWIVEMTDNKGQIVKTKG